MANTASWVVHKFGGSSVADAECFRCVAEIVESQPPGPQGIVLSACRGVTDALLRLIQLAETQDESYRAELAKLRARHATIAETVLRPESARLYLAGFDRDCHDLEGILHTVRLTRAAARNVSDLIAGYEWAGRADESLRGRVILFVWPRPSRGDWISRVIALPGERIRLDNGNVHIDGRALLRERLDDLELPGMGGRPAGAYRQYVEVLPNGNRYRVVLATTGGPLSNMFETVVPADHVFVLSDNRDNAIDSRLLAMMGPVPIANIRGVVTEITLSFDPDVSFVQRAAIGLFVAAPPSWYPPRTAEQWREAEEWRAGAPMAGALRLERSQLRLDRF